MICNIAPPLFALSVLCVIERAARKSGVFSKGSEAAAKRTVRERPLLVRSARLFNGCTNAR
jgi:hypothetical protein